MFFLYFILTNIRKCLKYLCGDFHASDDMKPNSAPLQRQTRSGYADLIAEATGAEDELLPILEKIMREEVFHSTLDWQSPAQFRSGARKALKIFNRDPDFYRAEMSFCTARFQTLVAEQALRDLVDQSASPNAVSQAKATYNAAIAAEQLASAAFDRELAKL